ncbi:MAG: hypothetical protein DI626_03790 [Micavibrio aeruginosavorus]|uniref:SPOR domain-containing protein n=1 Tax=Micavibrio aeruginosavorus TaxID=349221 RepID=A0A2W5A1R4_9BACT|nr:MAG: hypothetical protein DI626_03790 [Micavibrio aeruginosavorus]
MKTRFILFASISLLCAIQTAQAQPIESEPLGPAPYTLNSETDPMALGATDTRLPGQDAALPATPPPATDYQPEAYTPPADDTAAPAPVQQPSTDAAPTTPAHTPPDLNKYRNNPVSGVPLRDPHEFDNKIFCTMTVDFEPIGKGFDAKTDTQIKNYLESNGDKLTYMRKNKSTGGHYYCVVVADTSQRSGVYKVLKKLIPVTNSTKPSVALTSEMFAPVGGTGRTTYRD